MMEVEGEGNLLCPPLPPCGRERKRWGYPLLLIRKASRASTGYPLLQARQEEECLPLRPLPCRLPRGTNTAEPRLLQGPNRAEPHLHRRPQGPNRAEPKLRCSPQGEAVRGHLRPQPV